jgi:hypothetical protein
MFIYTVPNDKPQVEIGQAVAQEVELKAIPEQPLVDYCLCDLGLFKCEYTEPAFYNGLTKYENDYTTFYVNKVDTSDTIQFFVINTADNSEVELTQANAADYGVFAEGDNYKGIEVDFTTLKATYPALNRVKFKVVHDVFGSITQTETHVFQIMLWNEVSANNTVRIETLNSGRIESGNDYNELNWRRSVRIRGRFGDMKPELQRDDYMDGNRVIKQIQDQFIRKYTLETELLPQGILNMIAFNDMLANNIIISDYNLQNTNYKGIEVVPETVNANYYEKNPNGSYEIEFKARKENDIKRNY